MHGFTCVKCVHEFYLRTEKAMGTLNRGGLAKAILASFSGFLNSTPKTTKEFKRYKPGKRSHSGTDQRCRHSKLSFATNEWKGYNFQCRTCNMFLFVPEGKLIRPYSQNVYVNRFYDGVQTNAPNFLNPPYRPGIKNG